MSLLQRTPLVRIAVAHGDVLRALRTDDPGFAGFGEAYFSTIEHGAAKGWKRHRAMTMNLVVPTGRVRFAFVAGDLGPGALVEMHDLSPDRSGDYARLTVPPGYWMAFAGINEGSNLVLNIADRLHDDAEVENAPLATLTPDWQTR